MEGLPLLPGYSLNDPTKTKFNVPHNFEWKNGYPVAKKPTIGVGGDPLVTQGVLYSGTVPPVRYDPSLTYGRAKTWRPPKFQPHFVLYSGKCLTFRAFFRQTVAESPDEDNRVRLVNIIYFLEDDTITIMEPKTENSGFLQGRLVKRARILKNNLGDYWHWKDFELGMDIEIYGIVYHICSCDQYTRAWLESQGVELGEPEELPVNQYLIRRRQHNTVSQITITPNQNDKLKKFLEFDKRVLRFYAIWDSRHLEHGELGKYIILYYLSDDTIDIIQEPRGDILQTFQSNTILKKTRIPKNWMEQPDDYCPLIHEKSDEDVQQYYGPEDFIVGKTVFLMGRKFYLYDCDGFTKRFYKSVYHLDQMKVDLPEEPKPIPKRKPLPPYTGFGTPEDSILSHFYLDPLSVNPGSKTDFIRFVQNTNKKLRYTAVMDWVHPEDAFREFVIEYRISDGNIGIHEAKQRNSGFKGGCFLKFCLVPKPDSNRDNPEYYTPADFRIGKTVEIFKHRFKITGVDLAVYRYMEANPEKFSAEAISEARRHLTREGHLTEDIKDRADFKRREEIAEPHFPHLSEGKH